MFAIQCQIRIWKKDNDSKKICPFSFENKIKEYYDKITTPSPHSSRTGILVFDTKLNLKITEQMIHLQNDLYR